LPRAKPATFGDRLRQLRERAALSQSELARRSGLGREFLCRLESGARAPGWETVRKLAVVLGCKTDDFQP
jgi:transcriptional regulator with XRE-family HTH domain